jgi:hypothetical protein
MKAALITLVCAAFLIASRMMAQVTTATISGTVMDSADSVPPKVKVVATQVATGVRTAAVTNDKGAYELPFLQPGPYKIDVDIKGFKHYVQENLNLTVGDHPTDDIHLQLGDEQQTVPVTGVPVQLATADDSIGQVVTTVQVESLPLYGRTPIVLAQNTAGVVSTTTPGQVRAFDNSGISAFSVGGLANKNMEILMDGAPDNASDNSISYSPMIDAVAEVRVHVFESDAD